MIKPRFKMKPIRFRFLSKAIIKAFPKLLTSYAVKNGALPLYLPLILLTIHARDPSSLILYYWFLANHLLALCMNGRWSWVRKILL